MTSVIALVVEFLLLYGSRAGGFIIADYVYAMMIFMFTFAFIFDLLIAKRIAYARGALLFAYFWRLFLLFWDIYGTAIYKLPNSGADSNMYFNLSYFYVYSGDPDRGGFFSTVMGTIFRITGVSKLYGQFLIMLASILAICIFARMLNELELDRWKKRWAVLLMAFLPNFAILSSIFLREAPVCLCLTLSVYLFYHWLQRGGLGRLALAFAAALLGARFHSGSMAVCIGYIAVILSYDRRNRRFRPNLRSSVIALLLSLLLVFLYLNYGDYLFTKMANVDSIEDIGYSSDYGGSSYAQYVGDSATPLNMLIYTIPRIVYFLFSPFPWQWRGISDIIAFVFSGLFYLLSIVSAVRYLRSGDEKNRHVLIALLIIAAATTFVFAWGVSNTGTAARHRDKMVLIFGLIYAISLQSKRTDDRDYRGRHYEESMTPSWSKS